MNKQIVVQAREYFIMKIKKNFFIDFILLAKYNQEKE
jgi:hypothetical protein